MEFPKKFDSETVAFEDAEQSTNRVLTKFLDNWFPTQAREVLDSAISQINALEGIELKCKQLAYFGPQSPGPSMRESDYPQYVRIAEDNSTKWYNTYTRYEAGLAFFGAKDEVTDFFKLQKDMEGFKLNTLKLDYKDDGKKHRVTLTIENGLIFLADGDTVWTRQIDEKVGSDFQKAMDSFIENKGYILKPDNQNGGKKVNISRDSDKPSNQILADKDLQKRIQADIEHLDQLKQAQYEAMLDEERNAILAEIARREANDPNYQRPDFIPQGEKARSFEGEYPQTRFYEDRYSNEDRFQDEARQNFSRFP